MELFSDDSDNELYEAGEFDSRSPNEVEQVSRRFNARINYCSELTESEFVYRFHINKITAYELLLEITPTLKVRSSRNHGVSPLHQLLLALRFYALGTMLISVADFIGVSIPTASRIVRGVSRAIAGLYKKYIKIRPNTQPGFHAIAGFPRVLGALDCTHILIQSPSSNVGEEFRNRKGAFSLNVQGVCDADLILMNVVARWPGSAHDATIFNNSALKVQCEDRVFGNRWLIGDSAYPCNSYLLTPLLNPSTSNEHRYNDAHVLTRNPIERCFGVWKRRFPVLSLKIRLALDTVQAVIIATSILHNICRMQGVAEVEPEVDLPPESSNSHITETEMYYSASVGQQHSTRQHLIDSYSFNI